MKGWEKSTVESTGDYLWKIIWIFLSVEYISLGMENEVWEIADTSQDIIQTHGEWELLGINKATPKKSVGTNLYDQIIFYVSSEAFAFSFLFFFFFSSFVLVELPTISTKWISPKFQGFSVLALLPETRTLSSCCLATHSFLKLMALI